MTDRVAGNHDSNPNSRKAPFMSDTPQPRHGFPLSLRFCLFAFLAIGVVAGLLGRLFFRNLEVFLAVFSMICTAGPFLAAVITIVTLGTRQRPRSRGLVIWGIFLLLTPIVGMGALLLARAMLGPQLSSMTTLSNQQVIEQELVKRIDEPWVWNELESRLNAGKLNQAEVDAAINKLIAHMKATKPEGWDQPFHWQDDFLAAARQADIVSEPVLFDLCDVFYGPQPRIQPLPRVRESAQGIDITVQYGNTWDSHSGLGLKLVWEVTQVRLDGQPVEFRQNHRHSEQWGGRYEGALSAGAHEITVEVECAYIDPDKLIGLNEYDLPKSQWPKPRKQWKQTVAAPLRVFTKDEPIVPLTTDPNRSPGPNGGVKIDRLAIQPDRDDSKKIVLKLQFNAGLPVPLSYDVAVVLDGETIPLGGIWAYQTANRSSSGSTQLTGRVSQLDESVQYAQVILTPNPAHIERQPEPQEIWGTAVKLPRTPLERLDLEAGQTASGESLDYKSFEK